MFEGIRCCFVRTSLTLFIETTGTSGSPGKLVWMGARLSAKNNNNNNQVFSADSLDVSKWNRVSRKDPDGPRSLSPRIANFAISSSGYSVVAVEGLLSDGGRGREVVMEDETLYERVSVNFYGVRDEKMNLQGLAAAPHGESAGISAGERAKRLNSLRAASAVTNKISIAINIRSETNEIVTFYSLRSLLSSRFALGVVDIFDEALSAPLSARDRGLYDRYAATISSETKSFKIWKGTATTSTTNDGSAVEIDWKILYVGRASDRRAELTDL